MDAKAILDILMQSGMGKSQQRLERAASGNNPLLDMAGSLLGGSGGGGGGALGGLLSQVLGGGASTRSGAGGGLGDVLGSLLGGGGAQAAGGGLAGGLIGSLAKAAMSQMAGGASGGGQAAAPGFDLSRYASGQVETRRNDEDRAHVMIRAMLSAAKADGQIDAGEQQRILGKLNEAGASQEMRQFIQDELRKPVDVESLASEVDSPYMATEIYTASLFAIDVDTPGEQTYMNQLAARLGLPSSLVKQLHDSLEVRGA
ncbi:MAG: tellurite resistance TerB family protein [Alphaproteobacteria bacterium]